MITNKKLPLPNVIKYLAQNGWVKTSEIRGVFQIWHNKEFSNYEVTLPLCETHKRYSLLLDDALNELSECSHLPIDLLIKQMAPVNFDAIGVRSISPDIENGVIPFDDGVKLLMSSHKLLKHCTNKIQKFKNRGLHLSNYFNKIGMGQTQIGSYIIAIHSPLYRVPTGDESDFFENDVSLGRTINKLFYLKMSNVSAVFFDESDFEVITQRLLELGIDKNDCDAFIDIFGNQFHRDIEIHINWSSKESIDERYSKSIRFYAHDAQKIVDYREILKDKKIEKGIQLSGEIADLHRGYDDELGRAKLRTKYQGRDVSVSFTVTEDLYHQIANAHINKKVVTITGELEAVTVGQRLSANFKSFSNLSILENLEIVFPKHDIEHNP